jgi:hypothetical protein
MSEGNITSQSNLHSDVEMTDYQQPQLPATHNPVAGSPSVTNTDASPQPKACHKVYGVTPDALRLLKTPLPSHLSPRQILKNHPDRLFYNNILKVALHYNNHKIAARLIGLSDAVKAVTGRINTAIKWVAFEFNIDDQAFRTAFNRERRLQGNYHWQQKDKFDETVLAINADKINKAMAWIKEGGPHPSLATDTLNKVDQPTRSTRSKTAPVKAPKQPLIYACPHAACGRKYTKVAPLKTHILSEHFQDADELLQNVQTQMPFECPGSIDGVPCPEKFHTRQDRWQHICSKHDDDKAEKKRLLEIHFTFVSRD